MTSNAGSKESNTLGFNAHNHAKTQSAIRNLFSPEFRSRLDGIVHFSPLGIQEYRLIAKKFLNDLSAQLKDKNISITIDSKVIDFLATRSIDNELGAREIQHLIDSQIKLYLSDEILFGKLKNGGKVKVSTKTTDSIPSLSLYISQ